MATMPKKPKITDIANELDVENAATDAMVDSKNAETLNIVLDDLRAGKSPKHFSADSAIQAALRLHVHTSDSTPNEDYLEELELKLIDEFATEQNPAMQVDEDEQTKSFFRDLFQTADGDYRRTISRSWKHVLVPVISLGAVAAFIFFIARDPDPTINTARQVASTTETSSSTASTGKELPTVEFVTEREEIEEAEEEAAAGSARIDRGTNGSSAESSKENVAGESDNSDGEEEAASETEGISADSEDDDSSTQQDTDKKNSDDTRDADTTTAIELANIGSEVEEVEEIKEELKATIGELEELLEELEALESISDEDSLLDDIII